MIHRTGIGAAALAAMLVMMVAGAPALAFKGPRFLDESGIPMHADNQSVFKERIDLDKSDPNVLHDEITVTDHALTRPWTVTRDYSRVKDQRPAWLQFACAENTPHVRIGGDNFHLAGSADARQQGPIAPRFALLQEDAELTMAESGPR